ncbi:uncharacterized protein SCHCODRAFT_02544774 [Schizophyllum commune H4-8]|uniref:F-box domain-containing protein n=1 Tax=Schizophyllum commune (strain H4-8 / FGSC 9210) TaxID=578458 RepID=D8Q7K7_SCHCM|nr:uncharacterized protein SCHCODRAFT_02544774 [Schizophyllum commune H4-8]KAI5891449.1 hypothetical protein SCHCODRAFT_02544774 [Schizophyllum commune H4-8]
MVPQIFQLPIELLTRILLYLDPSSLEAVEEADPRFAAIAQTPTLLKHYATSVAQLRCTSDGDMTIDDLLSQVEAAGSAWRDLKSVCTLRRSVPPDTAGLYELSGGYIFFGKGEQRRGIYFMPLPTPQDPDPEWSLLNIGEYIIDFALSLYEHSLLVAVTSRPDTSASSSSGAGRSGDLLEIRLLEFPSGRPHPLAQQNPIPLLKTPRRNRPPLLGIEIVGDTMVIAAHYPRVRTSGAPIPPSTLNFYNWKEGTLKMTYESGPDSYTTFVFLTEDLILVPNTASRTLEYWRISTTDPKRPAPAAILHLPPLRPRAKVFDIQCRAEPNPRADVPRTFPDPPKKGACNNEQKGKSRMTRTEPPFYPASEEALCIFQVVVLREDHVQENEDAEEDEDEDEINGASENLVLVVHRSAFVKIFEQLMKESIAGNGAHPTESTSLPADSADPSTTPSDSTSSLPSLPWSDWGPPVSRWLDFSRNNHNWITTSCGQRMVATASPLFQSLWDDGLVNLYDFNPYAVEAARKEEAAQQARRAGTPAENQALMNTRLQMFAPAEGLEQWPGVQVVQTPTVSNEAIEGSNIAEDQGWEEDGDGDHSLDLSHSDEGSLDAVSDFMRRNPGVTYVQEANKLPTLFAGKLDSQLPCVVTHSPRHLFYSGVMMDHRRIIGTVPSADGNQDLDIQCFY